MITDKFYKVNTESFVRSTNRKTNERYIVLTNMKTEELIDEINYLKEKDLKGEISDEDLEEIHYIENLLKISND